jgi:putative transposase
LCAGLPTGAVQPGGVVSPQLGMRSIGAAIADPPARPRPARFGYQRIWLLLRRESWRVNRKRVRRLYRLDGLQVRMRVRRRKHMALHRGPAPVPAGRIERWSMDFVHDALADGWPFRILTVVDQ